MRNVGVLGWSFIWILERWVFPGESRVLSICLSVRTLGVVSFWDDSTSRSGIPLTPAFPSGPEAVSDSQSHPRWPRSAPVDWRGWGWGVGVAAGDEVVGWGPGVGAEPGSRKRRDWKEEGWQSAVPRGSQRRRRWRRRRICAERARGVGAVFVPGQAVRQTGLCAQREPENCESEELRRAKKGKREGKWGRRSPDPGRKSNPESEPDPYPLPSLCLPLPPAAILPRTKDALC